MAVMVAAATSAAAASAAAATAATSGVDAAVATSADVAPVAVVETSQLAPLPWYSTLVLGLPRPDLVQFLDPLLQDMGFIPSSPFG